MVCAEYVPFIALSLSFLQSILTPRHRPLSAGHQDFRIPEFASAATYLSLPWAWAGPIDVHRPFMTVYLPSDAAARLLASRCTCIKSIWAYWSDGATHAEMHAKNRANPQNWTPYIPENVSWKATVQAFNATISSARQRTLIESFQYMEFLGPIKLKDPDLDFGLLEDYSRPLELPYVTEDPSSSSSSSAGGANGTNGTPPREREQGDTDDRFVRVWLGRLVARGGARDLIDKLSLKKRAYIGNTSMEAEMSLIMASMALVSGKTWIEARWNDGCWSADVGAYMLHEVHASLRSLKADKDCDATLTPHPLPPLPHHAPPRPTTPHHTNQTRQAQAN